MGYAQVKKRKLLFNALKDKVGGKMAKQIFAESDFRFNELMREYSNKSPDEVMHIEAIVHVVSIYETMSRHMPKKDAYGICRYATKGVCDMVARLGSFITFFPGGSRLVLKIMSSLEKDMFGEKNGFIKETLIDNPDEFRFKVHKCPYFDLYNKYGCPELCKLSCESDQWSYGSIKRFTMIQRSTLGFGDECCDYTYRSDKFKEEVK